MSEQIDKSICIEFYLQLGDAQSTTIDNWKDKKRLLVWMPHVLNKGIIILNMVESNEFSDRPLIMYRITIK